MRPGVKASLSNIEWPYLRKGVCIFKESISMVLFDDMIENGSYREETCSLCEINMYSYVHKPFEF